MTEAELFIPIKAYFEDMGFMVDGEVGDVDMLMSDKNSVIAVELKKELNLKLLIQGAKRQKIFDQVYVAIWSPKNLMSKAFKDKIYLLNRLGIGLILVTKRAKRVTVYQEPKIHPVENYRTRNKKRKAKLVDELSSRKIRTNVGGVTQKKILTAYKEDALLVLNELYPSDILKASEIKKRTGVERAYTIVYNNHYGWFAKEGKGLYTITDQGRQAYKENREIIDTMKDMDS